MQPFYHVMQNRCHRRANLVSEGECATFNAARVHQSRSRGQLSKFPNEKKVFQVGSMFDSCKTLVERWG